MKKAVILLSGGLDSTTILYCAKHQGFLPYGLIFDYKQRHRKEIYHAQKVAEYAHLEYKLVKISMPWFGSALLDKNIPIPEHREISSDEIPSTYVPARNIIFLSFAASYAEAIGAQAIFIGANAIDYSGYPDCRPEFYSAYQNVLETGLKAGVEGKKIKIKTPLIKKTKAQIIRLGLKLNVPYHLTWSCYKGQKNPCGKCDSCLLRARGFEACGITDPLVRN